MAGDEPVWVPDGLRLAGDLSHLRRLLDRRTPRFGNVSELARVAELLFPDEPDGMKRLRSAVRLAASHPRAAGWAKTALLLYGLADKSEGRPLSERRKLAFEASNETRLETWRTAREREMATDLAAALIERLAEQISKGLPSADAKRSARAGLTLQYPPPAQVTLSPADLDDHSDNTTRATGALLPELQAACKEGVRQATVGKQISNITALAETVGGNKDVVQQVESLFMWAIYECEPDDRRRIGVADMFGLGPCRAQSWTERRTTARRRLSVNNDTKQKPYRPGEEESRVILKLTRLLAALAGREAIDI